MIKLASEKRRIRNGNNNFRRMLERQGWWWSRASGAGDRFTDTFGKNDRRLIVTGIAAWEDSKSDFQIFLDLKVEATGVRDHQVIATEDQFVFRKGSAHWTSEEAKLAYLRNLNDLCEFTHQFSG